MVVFVVKERQLVLANAAVPLLIESDKPDISSLGIFC